MTQRRLASYLVEDRRAHDHFTVNPNQPRLLQDLVCYFRERRTPDFVEAASEDHGRIECRRIWTTTALNRSSTSPMSSRPSSLSLRLDKKTGQNSVELA